MMLACLLLALTALVSPPLPYPADFTPVVAAEQNADQKERRFLAWDTSGRGLALRLRHQACGWIPVASLPDGARLGDELVPSGDQHLLLKRADGRMMAYGAVTDAWCDYDPSAPRGRFSASSWIVVGLYALFMVGMATYFMRKKKTADDYFRGGGRIPWYVAGMSIFATMLSSVTFIAIPAMTYISDWRYFPMQVCIFLVAPIAIFFYLPFFCRLNITSAYEYLERRFNLGVRLFGSAAFVVFMICRVAVVTLLPALALNAVTGVSIDACILICGVVTMVYCSFGGLEAVVWSDFVQGIVLMGGALAVLVTLVLKTGSDGAHVATFWHVATESGKTTMFDFRFLFTEPVFWVVMVQGFTQNLAHYTSDQCIIQRYVSTPDERATRRSIWFNGVMSLFSSAVFFALGTALYTHYKTNPAAMDVAMPKADSIFPTFMATELPPWLAGLVIAALFAATISTLSANLSSAATAVVADFVRRFRPGISDRAQVRAGQVATFAAGFLGVGAALVLARQDSRSLFDTFGVIVGILCGGMAGIFALGVFVPRVKGGAAIIGLTANYVTCFLFRFFVTPLPFHPFLLGGLGLAVGIVTAVVISYVLPERGKDLKGLTLKTIK